MKKHFIAFCLLIGIGTFSGLFASRAYSEEEYCHWAFLEKGKAEAAVAAVLKKVDPKKYKIKLKKFKGYDQSVFDYGPSSFWYLVAKPGDSDSKQAIEKVSREMQAYDVCSFVPERPPTVKKPIIYLYPTRAQDVLVRLDFQGDLLVTYPTINEAIGGWKVFANPDGKLVNREDGKEYSYLFWEGKNFPINEDFSTGFVVAGKDTKDFLQSTLEKIGLEPREYNEFIVYWLPLMQDNPYNLIHFAGEEYTRAAPLNIEPKPDSMLRVFMMYRALEKPVNIPEQALAGFTRKGFSVIEWGGTEIR